MMVRCISLFAFLALLLVAQPFGIGVAHAQWPEEGKLLGPDTEVNNFLGISVAVSGHVAVVGASNSAAAAASGGSAYVFRYNADTETWDFEQQLTASDPAIGQFFGSAVAISGHVIVIGAVGDTSNSGAAYVFRYNGSTWVEEQKLSKTPRAADDRFGIGVSVSGSVIVVGADGDDDAGSEAGTAFVFRYDGATWSPEQQLLAPSAAMGDNFGEQVSVDGDVIAAGKYGDSDNGANSGAIHIFRYDGTTWNHEQKVTASDGAANDFLGRGVSVSGDVVVGSADSASDNGKSYVYRYDGSTWNEEQILTAPSPAANGLFGQGVSVSGDTILAGETDNANNVNGQAHVYRYNGASWDFEETIEASDGTSGAFFGFRVALSGDTAIVGAPFDNELGSGAGAAYTFRFAGPLTNSEEQILTASNASNSDYFGQAVSVYGDVAIVGTFNAGTGGIAYVYRYNGLTDAWDEEQIINNPGTGSFDNFGRAVDVFGDVAIIGAFSDSNSTGQAYIYRYDGDSDTWILEHTCIASDAASGDDFGESVSIHGDVAVIGASQNDLNDFNSGSAYVFRYDESMGTWQEEQILAPVDTSFNDWFGSDVSIWGDVVVVSAPNADDLGSDSNPGAFYVYRYDGSTWVEEQRLTASNADMGNRYSGSSVSIFGDTILASTQSGDGVVEDSGAAYIFRFNGDSWAEEQLLFASDGVVAAWFGHSVSLWGDTALIGALRDGENGSQAGAAYLFRYNGSTWIEEEKLLASDGTSTDSLGSDVSVFGDVSLVGAPAAEGGGSFRGQAYVFRGGAYTNTAPVAVPGGPYFAECRDLISDTTVMLDGSGSSDPNLDDITYSWGTDRGTFDDDTIAQPTLILTGEGPGAVVNVTLEVSDGVLTNQVGTTVTVQDTTAPVITLDGDNPLFIECNVDTYVDPGATAFDACWGVTNVTVGGDTVDESTLGTYVVRYSAEDDSGNSTGFFDRDVIVRDTTPPTITLNGDSSITLECGVDTYTELGAMVTDICDDTVTVDIGGDSVDDATPGVYTVTYNATDASSNAAVQVTRTVTVQDTTAPTVSLVGDNPVILTVGDTYAEDGATANDICDGDVTASIVITGSVNTGMAGSYVLTYTAKDAANNSGQTTRTVNVLADTEAPIITLDGANPLFLNVGDTFTEPGFSANDLVDGNITGDVVVTGSVDTQTPGDYVLTYAVSDSGGNSAQAQRTVTVLSTSNDAPVITLNPDNPLELVVGDTFTEPGFGASDTEDGNLTGSVIVTGSVNTAAVGSYILTYTVTDSDNNTTQVQRIVNVSDVGAPVITLSGPNPQTIECGPGTYTDPGFSATDDVDGNVTGSVVISGDTVDPSTPGSYTVIYTVSDSSTNTAQTSRIVTVVDTTAPVLSLIGGNPLSITLGDTFSEPGFSALDVCDGNLAGSVVVTGTVDTGTFGSYDLTYTVSDNAGNQTQVVRTVNVVATPTDVNEDGVTNAIDIQTVINIVLGIFTGTADVNNDGQTNAVDIQLVINAVLGI